jgi:class I fructose-bisphosphate aldolase
MNIGKLIRLNRLFSHPSGHYFCVAVDHFIGYQQGIPEGLRDIQSTLDEIVKGKPDAITLHKGILLSCWSAYAGSVPIILQSMIARPDDSAREPIAFPEDAIRLGADGFAVAIFVRGNSEAFYLRLLADMVRQASVFEMPVICHVYPRDFSEQPRVSFIPEDIAWSVRCAVEAGADVVKTPYCGDISAFRQIVSECPVPLVAAGGPKAESLISALHMVNDVMKSEARGVTVGRNVWGFTNIEGSVRAFNAVIHDGIDPEQAIKLVNENRS